MPRERVRAQEDISCVPDCEWEGEDHPAEDWKAGGMCPGHDLGCDIGLVPEDWVLFETGGTIAWEMSLREERADEGAVRSGNDGEINIVYKSSSSSLR